MLYRTIDWFFASRNRIFSLPLFSKRSPIANTESRTWISTSWTSCYLSLAHLVSDIATDEAARTEHQYEIVNQATGSERATFQFQRNTRLINFGTQTLRCPFDLPVSIPRSRFSEIISVVQRSFSASCLSPHREAECPCTHPADAEGLTFVHLFPPFSIGSRPPYWDPLQPILGWSRPLEP